MKTIAKGILTIFTLIVTTVVVFAQKGVEDGSKFGHGEDSIKCIKNLSLYREYVKQKNYDLAQDSWAHVYSNCPRSSKHIYVDGIKMIKKKIKNTEDQAEKSTLLDSMMNIYDQRMKYYKQKGLVLGYKGVDFIKYSDKTPENMQIAYNFLRESIEIQKYKSKGTQLLTFMEISKGLFVKNVIEGGEVVENYGKVSEICDYVINNKKKGWKRIEKAKPLIDKVFEESGAATCEDLIPFYTNKFAKTPEDIEFLEKAVNLLRSTKCTESELFFSMTEKLNSLKPSVKTAYELAKITNKVEKLDDAKKYYLQAIELETEDLQKAKYYLELGDVARRQETYKQARTYALKAIELDKTSGYPYLLIGNIYAAASKSCSDEEFHQKAVYWAAVDKFAKAKKVDPELAEKADKFISAYKAHFPDNETIFFYGFKKGDTYTVGCWINEKTVVRPR
ncbi:MAG: hypothetical protein MI739_08735 [Bacteroidales bacterium]|nr:hypothetical protein [Bacteroidales bacterium]